MARQGGYLRRVRSWVGAGALALVLSGCGGGPELVPGICRDGPRDPDGRTQQLCAPRSAGDPVRIVTDPGGSWPVFVGNVSGRPALDATIGALGVGPPRFDPRRDQVIWPSRGRSPVIATFAVADPARGGTVSTLRVMFRPADGSVLGYRRVPR